ncbi:hypothetical protein A3H53_02020 [Candidatus Nomurabacteria bacterium RIFCSPLOWO2_02_FULL_40_10]|uniref:Uncharacterized protein n=2 Tax=Candidatus Nomuraibacteriota TaxID=1752729 RepID=A0A1F6XW67_9BACT|nr:MAG: hypothetical protein A2642_00445 [Candidatus Nomurabacteria bacterium RIFCSPHIGHO2_01_FULL_39_10]OGI98370.1 MAG: hypothetical protein A3H53_02020 [Candidatus Nomurabacteria bacterium RIFCSPLOWO2_02_FULL_40_10]
MNTKKVGQRQEFFPITSVCRDDLETAGFYTKNITDSTMLRLASKMANTYCENSFWIDLDILAEDLGIKKHQDKQ